MENNPFVTTREQYGRTEYNFDTAAFVRALADALGMAIIERENGFDTPRLDLGDGLTMYARADSYGANKGRVELSTYTELGRAIAGRYSAVKFPSINIDPRRPMDALVKDVRKRLIAPSAEPLATVKARTAEHAQARNSLGERVAALRAAWPGKLDITVKDNATSASLWATGSSGHYLHGTLYEDGRVSIDRIGDLRGDKAAALFAVLFAEPEKIAQCANCDWRGPVSKVLPDIPDYHERVWPGEPEPEGECPECHCLCHVVAS
jgi:hypothetical protein